ncbi:unnamed protein product [Pleuronectes platessa]|uniref:Uncharacterized protein n=1 Tax=Pleuronectes platessa TaxID=8262 RepID=A0A9N7VGN3_PLEPL|nr:unnamed protein product [Pleuronectes platessa]
MATIRRGGRTPCRPDVPAAEARGGENRLGVCLPNSGRRERRVSGLRSGSRSSRASLNFEPAGEQISVQQLQAPAAGRHSPRLNYCRSHASPGLSHLCGDQMNDSTRPPTFSGGYVTHS